MFPKKFILFVIITSFSFHLFSQNSFEVYYSTNQHETFKRIFVDTNDSFIGVLSKNSYLNDFSNIDSILCINIDGDLSFWDINLERNDTIFQLNDLIRDKFGNYILTLSGTHYLNYDSIVSYFDCFMKFDENKNLIYEKIFNRSHLFNFEIGALTSTALIQLKDEGFLYSGIVKEFDGFINKAIYLVRLNNELDTLYTKILPQYYGKYIMSITYNHDSSNFLLHKTLGSYPDCNLVSGYHDGALVLDTNQLDVESGICYNNGVWNSIGGVFDAELTSTGDLIVAGQSVPYPAESFPLSIFKYDSSLAIVKTNVLTDPDSSFYPGWVDNIDINTNDEIFVSGAFDHGLAKFSSHYCKIYVAKLDTDLNVLSERYLGGDASYDVYSMAATTDGGCIIGGFKYDYQVNGEEEGDAFIIKTDPDLWVDIEENNTIPIHSALCYPNPGNDILNIRTTSYNSDFMLFDEVGRLLLTTEINKLVTEINTSKLKRGVYFWKLVRNKALVDRGKWIKN